MEKNYESSFAEFGTYTEYEDLRTLQMENNFFWLSECTGVRYGFNSDDAYSFLDEQGQYL